MDNENRNGKFGYFWYSVVEEEIKNNCKITKYSVFSPFGICYNATENRYEFHWRIPYLKIVIPFLEKIKRFVYKLTFLVQKIAFLIKTFLGRKA